MEAEQAVYFEYGEKEIGHLKQRDRKLANAIDRIGFIRREMKPQLFVAIVDVMISQQTSGKAAKTILQRLAHLTDGITALSIDACSVDDIQQCGMSFKKAAYIKGLADKVLSGAFDLEALRHLPDAKVIESLVQLDGIGLWSAEMLLLFCLGRPDVLSFGDLAIRRGMMRLYDLQKVSKAAFQKYRSRYSPYGSVASLYLWRLSVLP
ncbi:MAG: hypothetical protein WCX86_11485 [Candidatus Hydrogenedentales bacterium]